MTIEPDLPGEEQELNAVTTQTVEGGEEDNQIPAPTPQFPSPASDDCTQDDILPDEEGLAAPSPPIQEPRKECFPFDQRIDFDADVVDWNSGDWELPHGALKGGLGDQVTVKLSDSFPAPARVFLRVISCWGNGLPCATR